MGDSRRVFVLGLFVILLGSIAYSPTQPANAGGAPPPLTFTIIDNDTGGDCEDESIGHWNANTKTCRLTTDLILGIVIDDDGITLDCKRHSIVGTGVGFGIEIAFLDFVTIKNCTITHFSSGIFLNSSHDNTIIRNLIHDNGSGILLSNSSFLNTISDNTVSDNLGNGIILSGASGNDDNTFIDNILNNNGRSGFDHFGGNDNHLEGNTANQNGDHGIILRGNDHTLIGNTFNDNDLFGLLVTGDLNDLFDNSANHNGEEGIVLTGTADDNTLQGNTASHNGANGMIIDGDDNDLDDNNASHNAENGIVVTGVDNELDENSGKHNALFGFEDDTTGATGDLGTDNNYTDNKCVANGSGGSDPTGLCSPQA